ncbi:hypothetical protein Hypma_016477 [Hypsizygus marmoreus]|uniref:F-box domain-containing protein n=1 Tax=Hypsizygus marmoreus TaxID=39966 RepID=A0A369J0B1_HYPMA|nr:hypothetical protein Hypma_016477 [Hypsizygus marmoreus]
MHRCLDVQEILSLICKEASGGDPLTSTSHKTLAALAQSCKTLEQPALDALWHTQTDLTRLLRCFPADALNTDGHRPLTFCRPLTPDDWSRVLFYTPRIKVLQYQMSKTSRDPTQPDHDLTDITVWQMLAISRPPTLTHLLPNLRHLAWHESEEAASPYIRLLLSPTLSYLELWTKTRTFSSLLLSLVPSILGLCPLLEGISLRGLGTTTAVNIVSNAICQWMPLRHLGIGALTPNAFIHIARMPRLQTLHLFDLFLFEKQILPSSDEYFPALLELVLLEADPLWATDLITSTTPFLLRKFGLRVGGYHAPSEWKQLLTALVSLQSTLTSLVIKEIPVGMPSHIFREEHMLNYDVLKPLLDLPNLTVLKVGPIQGVYINNEELKELSVALPCLRELELGLTRSLVETRITLAGLIPLIIHCPDLETLGICVNAAVIDYSLEASPGIMPRNEKFRSLSVGDSSSIEDAVHVAAFLMDVFPHLTSLEVSRYADAYEIWTQVARLLRTFATRRFPVI